MQGRYADIKKLLYSFESNPRFLLPENVALATDEAQPDALRLNLTVAHYFRPEGVAPRPAARRGRRRGPPRRRPLVPRRSPRRPRRRVPE